MSKFTLELMDKKGLEYGLADTIDVEEEEFNGNSKAIYIGSKDNDGNWVELAGYTPEDADKVVNSGTYLFEDNNTMFLNGSDEPTYVKAYYVPYVVRNHLSYEPSLRWMPVLTPRRKYKAIVERMFGYEGRLRYIHSIIEFVCPEDTAFSIKNMNGIINYADYAVYSDKAEKYLIDMYDIFGNKSNLMLDKPEDLENYLLSIRLVAIQDAD